MIRSDASDVELAGGTSARRSWRARRHDVYIARPSKWGSPFQIGRDGTRAQVIARYERWLTSRPELLAALPELAGKTLGCWCAPKACHGEVLARLAAEFGPGS